MTNLILHLIHIALLTSANNAPGTSRARGRRCRGGEPASGAVSRAAGAGRRPWCASSRPTPQLRDVIWRRVVVRIPKVSFCSSCGSPLFEAGKCGSPLFAPPAVLLLLVQYCHVQRKNNANCLACINDLRPSVYLSLNLSLNFSVVQVWQITELPMQA